MSDEERERVRRKTKAIAAEVALRHGKKDTEAFRAELFSRIMDMLRREGHV